MSQNKPVPSKLVAGAPAEQTQPESTLTDLLPPSSMKTTASQTTASQTTASQETTGEVVESVMVIKDRRLASKVQRARELLSALPAGDRAARLLHAAIVRRDETLLDELLAHWAK